MSGRSPTVLVEPRASRPGTFSPITSPGIRLHHRSGTSCEAMMMASRAPSWFKSRMYTVFPIYVADGLVAALNACERSLVTTKTRKRHGYRRLRRGPPLEALRESDPCR